jgi:hypothetical protein
VGTYDELLRWLREQERILQPIHKFDNLYGSSLRNAVEEAMERDRTLQSIIDNSIGSYQQILCSIQPELERMAQIEALTKESKAIADAHESLSRQLAQYAIPKKDLIDRLNVNPSWASLLEQYSDLTDSAVSSDLALKSHISTIAESAFLAQERMMLVDLDSLGLNMGLKLADVKVFSDTFSDLTDEYRSLIRSFQDDHLAIASLPPIASSAPSIEILTSAKVVGSLSTFDSNDGVGEAESPEEQEFAAEIEASVEELLAEVNADLRAMWRGAKHALLSDNPDRTRHVVVSLRELVGHVLRSIAPDDEIQQWTKDPEHFHEGRPTRKARVLYVSRGINHGPFSTFVAADVKSSIECINLFQRGTHELTIGFSEPQLQSLFLRTESLLRFLLLTSKSAE